MKPFSHSDIRKIQQFARDRQRKSGDPNLLAVGIGQALKNGRPDPDRPLALQYIVRKKVKNPNKHRRVKEKIKVSLPGGKKARSIALATDVIELGNMVPTAATVNSDNDRLSSGYFISWPQGWGFLTAGHGFATSTSGLARITYRGSITGRVLAQTSSADTIDAALIEVSPQQIQQMFGPVITPASVPLYCRPFQQLVSDTQLAHAVCTMEVMKSVGSFQLLSFISDAGANGPLIPALPELTNLFFGQSSTPQFFVPGVSGAGWLLLPHVPAAMQVAGNDPDFNHGFGISLEIMLRWAARQVQAPVQLRGML